MKKITQLSDYNDIHSGETIFILGNGRQLADISQDELLTLESKLTIGTNASYSIIQSPYYIAGHMSVMLLICNYTTKPSNKVFHGEPQYYDFPKDWNLISIADKNIVGPPGYLPKPVDNSGPLVGAENVGISATHLAHIMGAKRIVYVGFDFKSNLHFYNIRMDIFNTLKSSVESIREMYIHDTFIYEDIGDYYKAAFRPLDVMGQLPFPTKYDHALNAFTGHFNTLKSQGVEVISTLEDSIITEAGATYLPLNTLLYE